MTASDIGSARPIVARMRRVLAWPLVRLVLGLFSVGLGIALGGALAKWLDMGKLGQPLLLSLGAWLGYCGYVRAIERRRVTELAPAGAAREWLLGVAIGAGLFGTVIGVLALLGVYSAARVPDAALPTQVLAISFMAAVTEELLIRGIVFRVLEGWLGSWIALAISAALFGAGHLANPGATLLAATAVALEAGVMLAAAYLLTRRLWLVIGIHGAWNFTQGGVFGLVTSGHETGPGWVLGRLQGPDWLSGGAFGAEASVVAVVVCLSAGIAMLVLVRRRGRMTPPAWRRSTP